MSNLKKIVNILVKDILLKFLQVLIIKRAVARAGRKGRSPGAQVKEGRKYCTGRGAN
jgi:hypothetical protein